MSMKQLLFSLTFFYKDKIMVTKITKTNKNTLCKIFNYKKYVKHKSLSRIYGKAYDWRMDG